MNLTNTQKKQFESLLNEFSSVFSKSDDDLGFCDVIKHEIKLKDDTPVRLPHRRLHPNDFALVKKEIQRLYATGVIRPSTSSYASPICVVKKKDVHGNFLGVRLTCDYRALNKKVVDEAVPLPRIEECLQLVSGAKVFSKLDLASGYFQLALHPNSTAITAFRPGTNRGSLGIFKNSSRATLQCFKVHDDHGKNL